MSSRLKRMADRMQACTRTNCSYLVHSSIPAAVRDSSGAKHLSISNSSRNNNNNNGRRRGCPPVCTHRGYVREGWGPGHCRARRPPGSGDSAAAAGCSTHD